MWRGRDRLEKKCTEVIKEDVSGVDEDTVSDREGCGMTQRVWDKDEDKEDLLLYGTERSFVSGTAVLADDDGLINSVCVTVLYDCYVLYFGRLKIVYKHNATFVSSELKKKNKQKMLKTNEILQTTVLHCCVGGHAITNK